VVTESFSEWVLAGDFPSGRPDWQQAGATIAADIEPHEQRKLRLLNGAHSLLAYAGLNRGLATIYDAAHHDECRTWVDRWWAEAALEMLVSPAEIRNYCAQLAQRWENRRMEHRLVQIAADGSQKLPARVVPVVRLHRASGALPLASIAILGAWVKVRRWPPTPRWLSWRRSWMGRLASSPARSLTFLIPVRGVRPGLATMPRWSTRWPTRWFAKARCDERAGRWRVPFPCADDLGIIGDFARRHVSLGRGAGRGASIGD
jgi:hypothetical protein